MRSIRKGRGVKDYMNRIADILLKIVKAALKCEVISLPTITREEWRKIIHLANYHNILGMIAQKTLECDNLPSDISKMIEEELASRIYLEASQEVAVQQVLEDFELAEIDYMPLKGFLIKNMYPSVEMRDMCDVDVLIRSEDIERIRTIMKKNNFQFKVESRHEYIFTANMVTIELHKSLVPPYNEDLYSYYGDGWRLAKKSAKSDHCFEMTFEDMYIYEVVHTAKHYLNGGTGIKQVADIYIMLTSSEYADADKRYIENELQHLGLSKFEKILRNLGLVWFDGLEYDSYTKEMSTYILNSGAWGSKQHMDASKIYRSPAHNRKRVIIKAIFPDIKDLQTRYKVIEKYPATYPFILIYRWFDVLLHRRSNIKRNLSSGFISGNDVKKFKDHCKIIGLKETL